MRESRKAIGSMDRKKQIRFSLLLALLALLVCPVWLTYQAVRQAQLNSALIVACKRRNTTAVASLLTAGANPNALDYSHGPKTNLLELWRSFLSHQLVPANAYKPAALQVAFNASWDARTDPTPLIRILLDKGAHPNVKNIIELSLLEQSNGIYPDCFRLLLQHGATLDRPGHYLAWACHCNDIETVKLLLKCGANINESMYLGCNPIKHTPLMRAVMGNHGDLVKLLIQQGADVNSGGNSNSTPLDMAKLIHHYHWMKEDNSAIILMLRKAEAKGYKGLDADFRKIDEARAGKR